MGIVSEFETLERQFLEIIGEFRTATSSESILREAIRNESARAEAAEAARDVAERAANESRNDATAATAGAKQATSALAIAQEQLTGLKIQLDLSNRQKTILEEKCMAMSLQINSLEQELHKLRPFQLTHSNLEQQYIELKERISTATEEARREASHLETELRRVEKCAAGGSEIRERARLAAAAHARERRLAAAELQHTTHELQSANVEIIKLNALVTDLQRCLKQYECGKSGTNDKSDVEALRELQSALEVERAGAAKLEQALAAALADNVTLAASLHSADNNSPVLKPPETPPKSIPSTNICQIDSFLAE